MIEAGLKSNHIVRLKKVCLEPDHYSLAMELMPKGSLDVLLKNNSQKLPWKIRFQIALDVAWGLKDLHTCCILHRDIKSLNILLSDTLRAKLSDLGASKNKDDINTQSTIKGSAGWMAPEAFEKGHTFESDIYSLGVVLWELASCKLPVTSLFDRIKTGKTEEIPGDCPSDFKPIIQSCWETVPAQRPNALQIVQRLKPLAPSDEKKKSEEDLREKETQQFKAEIERLKLEKEKEIKQMQEKHQWELQELKKHGTGSTSSPVQMTVPTSPPPKLSQNPHSIFHHPVSEQKYDPKMGQKEVEKLLLHVVGGEQDEAEAMLKRDPVLALSYGTVTDKSERKFSCITGFQYAVWALDWDMWEMMLRQFSSNEHWKLAAEQYQELNTKGTKHGKMFSLQPLIQALQTYSDKFSRWTTERRENQWSKVVGELQRQLPWHVINEYCRPDRPFYPCPPFHKEEKPLPRGKGREQEWFKSGRYHLGEDLAWSRSNYATINDRYYTITHLPIYSMISYYIQDATRDREALTQLGIARALQRKELGQTLKAKSAPSMQYQYGLPS